MPTTNHAHPMTLEERREAVRNDLDGMEKELELASRKALVKRLADFMTWLSIEYGVNDWRGQDLEATAESYLLGVDDAESENAAGNEIRHPWDFVPAEIKDALDAS